MSRDRTLDLLRDGYRWGARVRAGAGAAPLRFLGRRAAVVSGPEGVRRFYDPRLRRRGAFPAPIRLVLFGPGAVHGLDDAEHHHRKALFLHVLRPDAVAALGRTAQAHWDAAARSWAGRGRVVLHDEAVRVLAASVAEWAGLPLPRGEAERRGRQLATIVDGFGKPGPAYVRAVRARLGADRWARGLVHRVRTGELDPPAGTALAEVARARDLRGRLLPERVAGVELLNVLRPTVAVAWFVAFAGVALQEHEEWRRRIADGDEAAVTAVAQEVRRLCPFVPVLAARARCPQEAGGVRVPRGGFVVLDVHGTTHDPERWPEPERFDPERFLSGPVDPDAFVPQGGGDVATGHRCPGEDVVVVTLSAALRTLARAAELVPDQDTSLDLREMPPLPGSGVVLIGRCPVRHGEPSGA